MQGFFIFTYRTTRTVLKQGILAYSPLIFILSRSLAASSVTLEKNISGHQYLLCIILRIRTLQFPTYRKLPFSHTGTTVSHNGNDNFP